LVRSSIHGLFSKADTTSLREILESPTQVEQIGAAASEVPWCFGPGVKIGCTFVTHPALQLFLDDRDSARRSQTLSGDHEDCSFTVALGLLHEVGESNASFPGFFTVQIENGVGIFCGAARRPMARNLWRLYSAGWLGSVFVGNSLQGLYGAQEELRLRFVS
jgi:hypothetical protein